jgi:hypothetical protein
MTEKVKEIAMHSPILCPKCRHRISVPIKSIGDVVGCPNCQARFILKNLEPPRQPGEPVRGAEDVPETEPVPDYQGTKYGLLLISLLVPACVFAVLFLIVGINLRNEPGSPTEKKNEQAPRATIEQPKPFAREIGEVPPLAPERQKQPRLGIAPQWEQPKLGIAPPRPRMAEPPPPASPKAMPAQDGTEPKKTKATEKRNPVRRNYPNASVAGYKDVRIHGFKLLVHEDVIEHDETDDFALTPLEVLELELGTIGTVLPEEDNKGAPPDTHLDRMG